MFGSRFRSLRQEEIDSWVANKAYLAACEDRAKRALEPMEARPRIIWVERYGLPPLWRFQCRVHTVKLDLPDLGFMVAIPLDRKPVNL